VRCSPENDQESYFDYWARWSGQEAADFTPEVQCSAVQCSAVQCSAPNALKVTPFVGAGSDHASFLFYAGIPVMDITFVEATSAPAPTLPRMRSSTRA
jgi:hypothetical protein